MMEFFPELNQDKKSFSSDKDKKTISCGFKDSYFFPDGVIKKTLNHLQFLSHEIFPDLKGDKLVVFSI